MLACSYACRLSASLARLSLACHAARPALLRFSFVFREPPILPAAACCARNDSGMSCVSGLLSVICKSNLSLSQASRQQKSSTIFSRRSASFGGMLPLVVFLVFLPPRKALSDPPAANAVAFPVQHIRVACGQEVGEPEGVGFGLHARILVVLCGRANFSKMSRRTTRQATTWPGCNGLGASSSLASDEAGKAYRPKTERE